MVFNGLLTTKTMLGQVQMKANMESISYPSLGESLHMKAVAQMVQICTAESSMMLCLQELLLVSQQETMAQTTMVCPEWVPPISQSQLEQQMTKIQLIVKTIQLLDIHPEVLAGTTVMGIH